MRNVFYRSLLVLFVLLAFSCATKPVTNQTLQRYEYEQPEMGLPFRIVLYAPNQEKAEIAAGAAFTRIGQLNDILSDYDSDSELSRLSRTSGQGKRIKVGDDLWKILKTAQKISKESNGAFDVTVGPFVQLWRKARREKKMPDPTLLEQARAAVGYQKIKLYPTDHSVELTAKNMRLDLGGIAKGYAMDEAQTVLQIKGIRSALVSGGGDMFVSEPPPGKKNWKIELGSLDVEISTNSPREFVFLKNRGLATSGDTFQFVELDGKRYSHIVDPQTGIGLTNHRLVNVIAKNGMMADAMSKIVSVLPPEQSLPIIGKDKLIDARILQQPNGTTEKFETKRFGEFLKEK